jgi:hypothetical protein
MQMNIQVTVDEAGKSITVGRDVIAAIVSPSQILYRQQLSGEGGTTITSIDRAAGAINVIGDKGAGFSGRCAKFEPDKRAF